MNTVELLKETAAVVTALAVIFGAVVAVFRYIAKVHQARADALVGFWTNEGDITGPYPTHYLNLELKLKGRDVSGIVESRALETGTTLPNGSLRGCLGWGKKINGEVLDVSRARLVRYGTVSLRLRRGVLEWRTKGEVVDFLPTSAELWHVSEDQLKAFRHRVSSNPGWKERE